MGNLDYEGWRCKHDDKLFCPIEGCPASYGCARDHGWKPGDPSPPECQGYRFKNFYDLTGDQQRAVMDLARREGWRVEDVNRHDFAVWRESAMQPYHAVARTKDRAAA